MATTLNTGENTTLKKVDHFDGKVFKGMKGLKPRGPVIGPSFRLI